MSESQLDKIEVAAIVRSKKILSKIGMGSDLNIRKICDEIGISRKTAYEYDKKVNDNDLSVDTLGSREELKEENSLLKERLKQVELENEGLRIVKKVVDELKKRVRSMACAGRDQVRGGEVP